MDPEWTKVGAFVLGAVGTALGIYNLVVARHERKQKVKGAYATTLLWLDPVIERLIELPLSSPEDFARTTSADLIAKLADVEALLDASKDKLVSLVPEVAAEILNLQRASRTLRRELSAAPDSRESLVPQVRDLLVAAHKLAMYRVFAPTFGMRLSDQIEPSIEHWTGDKSVELLSERWKRFARAKLGG